MRNLLRKIILWALADDIAAFKSRYTPVKVDPAALDAYAAQNQGSGGS